MISDKAKKELVKMIKGDKDADIDALLSYAFYLLIKKKDEISYYFAYSIVFHYSILHDDYTPLNEFSIIFGFSPILNLIKNHSMQTEMQKLIADIFVECNKYQDKILSSGQKVLYRLINKKDDYSVVAPTSYGKTDLMIESAFRAEGDVIIIVPLVALLNQIRLDILNYAQENQIKVKVITHHEIKSSQKLKNIYVLTQERCYQLIKEYDLSTVTELYIDESHKLLISDKRAYKLSEVIVLLKRRYNVITKYYSPVLYNANSIVIKGLYNDGIYTVDNIRDMKNYNYYLFQNGKQYYYIPLTKRLGNEYVLNYGYKSKYDYIIKNSKSKNIIFLNSPRKIEMIAQELSEIIGETNNVGLREIEDFAGREYIVYDVLKSGIIYIHSQMPEIIRMYLIRLYREVEQIKYLITNSSILEGVNTPSENLFILDYNIGKKIMKPLDFINLRGRINRLGDVVKSQDIKRLNCDIHFVLDSNSKCYKARNEIIDKCYTYNNNDEIYNEYLLKHISNDNSKDFIESITRIKLIDEDINTKEMFNEEVMSLKDEFIEICIKNDIKLNQFQINGIHKRLEKYYNKNIDNLLELLDCISYIFNLEFDDEISLARLSGIKARKFYALLLDWLIKEKTIKEKAYRIRNYYMKNKKELIYVGQGRGEICAEIIDGAIEISEDGWSKVKIDKKGKPMKLNKLWVVNSSNPKELFNIGIIKIKVEEDFISYYLIPFIETLYSMDRNIISKKLYNLIKYHTDDEFKIALIKEGVSIYLVDLLSNKYRKYISIEESGLKIKKDILEVFNENEILKTELSYFL